jgi:hypothetical protein
MFLGKGPLWRRVQATRGVELLVQRQQPQAWLCHPREIQSAILQEQNPAAFAKDQATQLCTLLTGSECRSTLARVIHEPSSYETDIMEEPTQVVYQSVPKQAGCVVLFKRYATPDGPSQLTTGNRMFLECTILDKCGLPMNEEYTNGLFTTEAISSYLLTSLNKRLISRLIPAS